MEIVRRSENGIPILVLTGRLNQASADALHAAAMEVAGDETSKALVVDMGGVDFIASVGIRSLIRPSQALSMRGGKLAVANLSPQISEFFKLTGLDQMFRVYETVADATAAVA
ncbi:MAG: STAS domain-containing protein [Verrucomicrobia bacterium]|nr:STAS domain-containing protein [Verrucomicrobiota bacterium]MDA1202760.1 STAS domain-containing protein [Verrucomicrobiota bacterium]